MKPTDLEIAQACRDGVRRALGLPITARAADRVERRTRTQRRSGRGGSGTRDDVIDFSLYGLQNFSATNYLQTANPGGEPGTASGFGGFLLVRLNSLGAAIQLLTERLVGAAGYTLYMTAANLLTVECKSGGGISSAATYQFVASDVGRVIAIAFQHTGSAVRLLVSRVQSASGDVAITGYTAASGVTSLGIRSGGTFPFTTGMVLSEATFTGTPSVAQLQACFDVIRTIGDLPDTMSGATVTHLWSAKRELAGVTNPAGRKTYGARLASAANYFSTANGIGGHASGFSVAWDGKLETNLDSTSRTLFSKRSGVDGWRITASSTLIAFWVYDGAAALKTVSLAPNTADFGVRTQIVATWDGTTPRLYFRRAETVGGAGTAGFTASSDPTRIFRSGAVGDEAIYAQTYGVMGGSGAGKVFTAAEAIAVFDDVERTGSLQANAKVDHLWNLSTDIVANGLAMPTTVADRVGSDTMTRTGTLEVAIDTATAPPCPLLLTDRVTAAAGDALARVGSPIVKIIDPTIDGRRTLGAQGFSAANCFTTAAGKGIRGSAALGGFIAVHLRPDIASNMSGIYAESRDAGTVRGAIMGASSTTIDFNVYDAAGTLVQRQYTVTAGDVGQMRLAIMTWQPGGYGLRAYIGGVQVSTDLALATYQVPALTSPTLVGRRADGTFPLTGASVFGGVTGNAALTPAEVATMQAAFDLTGRIPLTATGKETWGFDLTTDILASGVDAVPATVLDRVGSDNLTKVGIAVQTDANAIRGVGPYSASDWWQTAPAGGIQGSNSGFHVAVDVWWDAIPTTFSGVACASNTAGGWMLEVTATGLLRPDIIPITAPGGYQLTGADINTRMRVLINRSATTLDFWVNGVLVNSTAQSTYNANAATVPMTVGGYFAGSSPLKAGHIEAIEGGNTTLTGGEITTLFASLTTTIPVIAGKTLKRYVFDQDIAAVSGALPARSTERISGGDDLVRVGSPLTLAQRTERLWSYETSSIMQTSLSPTAADRWLGAANAGLGGDAVGWFVAPLIRCTGALGGRFLTHSDGGVGWAWNGQAGGGVLIFQAVDGVGSKSAPSFALSPDGKVRPLLAVYDVPTGFLRSYANKAQIGTGTAISGYNTTGLSSLGCALGGFFSGGSGNASYDVIGFVFGYGVPTFAEFRAWEDACLAAEDIVALGGAKSAHMYSVKRGRTAGQLTDLIGTAHLALNGTPTITDIYSRAFAA